MNSDYYRNQMTSLQLVKSDNENKKNIAIGDLATVQSQIKELEDFLPKVRNSKLEIDDISNNFTTITSYMDFIILKGQPYDEGEFSKKKDILDNSSSHLEDVIKTINDQLFNLRAQERKLQNDIGTYTQNINNATSAYNTAQANFTTQSNNEAQARATAQQNNTSTQSTQNSASNYRGASSGGGGSNNFSCFQAGTKVITQEGNINIEEIKVGYLVLTYNEEKKENEYKEVSKLIVHENTEDELYTLYFDNNMLNVTSSHRFYVNGNWVAAKYLKVKDKLLYSNGSLIEIENIESKKYKDTYYNIEVKDNHNYYVSEKGILVHNSKMKIQ